VIRSRHFDGVLNYADLLIHGESDHEILLSTYICHPSMANNELSGPVVTAALGRWLLAMPRRHYTYRLVFTPETIGAIVYLSRNLERLREKVRAGFGQYCSPGADLPVCSVLRTRHGNYPEYHTSLDDLSLISPQGLQGAIDVYAKIIWLLENNYCWKTRLPGEPQLGRLGLYPTLSRRGSSAEARPIRNFLAYADGTLDLIEVAEIIGADALALLELIRMLEGTGIVVRAESYQER
jgi:aminopeptidase-like protein